MHHVQFKRAEVKQNSVIFQLTGPNYGQYMAIIKKTFEKAIITLLQNCRSKIRIAIPKMWQVCIILGDFAHTLLLLHATFRIRMPTILLVSEVKRVLQRDMLGEP